MQKLAEICVRRPVFATVIILVLTVIGGVSFFTLGVDRFPKIDIPTVSVTTTNTGAAPAEIETEVTDILEGAINTATGIDELRSSSTTGRSQITIAFDLSKDPDVATQEVRDKVNTVLNKLPLTADPPIVQKSDPDAPPIILYSMTGPYNVRQLTDIANDQIIKRIQSAYGVGTVNLYGARLRQINVHLDPDRMRAYNLSTVDVANALKAQNLELPGGRVNEGSQTQTLRTMSRVGKVEEFNNLAIANRNGYSVKIGDIGTVEDGGVDPTSISTLNGTPAVTLSIIKQSGSNTVAVINAVKQRMAEVIPTLPKDLHFQVIRDQSEVIVIEASIVVLENISRFVEEKGLHPFQAAIEGTREIGLAVLATTLSLLAVFLPVGFMGGIVGRFMSSFGLTSAAAIAVSLIVSFTLTPMLCARWIKAKKEEPLPAGLTAFEATGEGTSPEDEKPVEHVEKAHEHSSKESRFYRPIDRTYKWMLEWSMAHRWVIVLVSAAVIISIYPMFKLAGINFLPDEDESTYQVILRAPQGTSLAATQSILDHLARDIREQVPGIEATLAIAGFGSQSSPNTGLINIRLGA